mmetsp:Transcript_22658/g.71055  ORF Transcript_22658/g.71055 Transcript_22658/m.71055 type:complete len:266 (+) Transcript_22658:457-1254(+)
MDPNFFIGFFERKSSGSASPSSTSTSAALTFPDARHSSNIFSTATFSASPRAWFLASSASSSVVGFTADAPTARVAAQASKLSWGLAIFVEGFRGVWSKSAGAVSPASVSRNSNPARSQSHAIPRAWFETDVIQATNARTDRKGLRYVTKERTRFLTPPMSPRIKSTSSCAWSPTIAMENGSFTASCGHAPSPYMVKRQFSRSALPLLVAGATTYCVPFVRPVSADSASALPPSSHVTLTLKRIAPLESACVLRPAGDVAAVASA